MKLENQVVSLELAKKLKELGVKQESFFYWHEGERGPNIGYLNRHAWEPNFAAFTVAEMFNFLILDGNYQLHITKGRGGEIYYAILYHFDAKADSKRTIKEEIVGGRISDVLAGMLIYLLENKLITL